MLPALSEGRDDLLEFAILVDGDIESGRTFGDLFGLHHTEFVADVVVTDVGAVKEQVLEQLVESAIDVGPAELEEVPHLAGSFSLK